MNILIYDSTENTNVGRSWRIGAWLFSRWFDDVIAATSWEDVVEKIPEGWTELQFWGHGTPANAYIGHKKDNNAIWKKILDKSDFSPQIWLRVCSFAHGDAGKKAMLDIVSMSDDGEIAAFTHDIGHWGLQSGLVKLRAGEKTKWSSQEGGPGVTSGFGKPRTISALRMTV